MSVLPKLYLHRCFSPSKEDLSHQQYSQARYYLVYAPLIARKPSCLFRDQWFMSSLTWLAGVFFSGDSRGWQWGGIPGWTWVPRWKALIFAADVWAVVLQAGKCFWSLPAYVWWGWLGWWWDSADCESTAGATNALKEVIKVDLPEAVPVSDFCFILVAGTELTLMAASPIGFLKKNTTFHNTDGILATDIQWFCPHESHDL